GAYGCILGTLFRSVQSGMLQLTSKLSGFQLLHDELSFKVASLESKSDVLADQDGLKAWVDHGKAGNDLFVIEAYDPFAKAKYINIVNALGTVDFSLLSELRSKKDASMVDLMDSLCLEGPLAEIPRAEDLQPSSA
nr:hypothetical protein [Tanacetum cinerariifolium]